MPKNFLGTIAPHVSYITNAMVIYLQHPSLGKRVALDHTLICVAMQTAQYETHDY